MKQKGNTLYADEGKWLRRIADHFVYGKSIKLGYTYYIGGELQDPPHKDVAEDFEEVESEEGDGDDTESSNS